DPGRGPDGRGGFDPPLQEPEPLPDGPAVLVGAAVRLRLEELVDQVAVGCVEFHAVETGLLRSLGGSPVIRHDPWNLGGFQRPWDFVRLLAGGRVDVRLVALDGRGSDGGLAAVEAAVRSPSCMPKLEEDHPALVMNGGGG